MIPGMIGLVATADVARCRWRLRDSAKNGRYIGSCESPWERRLGHYVRDMAVKVQLAHTHADLSAASATQIYGCRCPLV